MSGIRYDGNLTTAEQNLPVGASAPVYTMPYAQVTVYEYGTPPLTLATLYSDEALTIPIANPITTDPQGRFGFWIAAGVYTYIAKTAIGVLIGTYNLTLTAPQGPTGTAATISIGSVQNTAPGAQASVSNSGTENDAVLNFVLPQGQTGPTGPTGATGTTGQNGIASLPQLASVRAVTALGSASANLFDVTQVTGGFYISAGNGALVADGELSISGFIAANSGGLMTTSDVVNSGAAGITFYDQDQNFLSSLVNQTPGTFAVPATAAFVRITFSNATPTTVMVVVGSTLPASFQSFNYYPANIVDEKLTGFIAPAALAEYSATPIVSLDNLFIPANATTGIAIHTNGVTVGGLGANYFTTDYMAIVPSGNVVTNQVTVNGGDTSYGWVFYDFNKNYISGTASLGIGNPVAVPSNALYVRVSFDSGVNSDLQICAAATLAPSLASQVTAITNVARPYSTKKWMLFGDSISAIFNPGYATTVVANTGLTVPYQDARGGRTTQFIFENYSNNPATGIGLGGFFGINGSPAAQQPTLPYSWSSAGNTLAQDLAQIDVVTVYLGTNDGALSTNLGALGDPNSQTGSYYSILRYAIEGFLVAKPGLQLLWVGPYQNNDSGGQTSVIAAAQQSICALYGIPYLNLCQLSGINTLNIGAFTGGDDIHPNALGLAMLSRLITASILNR